MKVSFVNVSLEMDDRDYFELLFRDVKPKQVYVDVGAFNGDTVERALKIMPDPIIVAIEPIKSLCDQMKRKFSDRNKVIIVNKACWAEQYKMTFYEYMGGGKGLSTLLPVMTQMRPSPMIQYDVDTDTLDNILIELNISTVDYLKIDTEGSEDAILFGFTRYHSGTRFHIEFHMINLANILQRLMEMNAQIEKIIIHRDPNIKNHVIGAVIGEFI